jgi:hypothetical protein
MPYRILAGSIILFWATMTAWLLQREVLPAWRMSRPVESRTLLEHLSLPYRQEFGIYLAHGESRRIGWTRTRYEAASDGGLRIESRTRIGMHGEGESLLEKLLPMAGQALGEADLAFTAELDADFRFHRFRASLAGMGRTVSAVGEVVGSRLRVQTRGLGLQEPILLDFRPDAMVEHGLTQALVPGNLHVGQSWSVFQFSPAALRKDPRNPVERMEVRVTAFEERVWDGREIPVYVLFFGPDGRQGEAWVDAEGEMLFQRLILGRYWVLELRKEEAPPGTFDEGSVTIAPVTGEVAGEVAGEVLHLLKVLGLKLTSDPLLTAGSFARSIPHHAV